MGLPFLRPYLHGLYITVLITVIITVSPSEAACCQDSNNHCGAALSSLCQSSNLLPDSLYICKKGGDPSLIRICPDGCQAHVGGNDICKRVPVDNKTVSQLLSDTELKQGQSLFSPDKKTKLLMQMNGDLVVSIIGADLMEKSVWSTGTSSLAQPPVSVRLLENGDLVLLNAEGGTMWRLGTAGAKYAGASLWVRNGGLLCLAIEPDGNCLWKSVAAVTSTPISKLVPDQPSEISGNFSQAELQKKFHDVSASLFLVNQKMATLSDGFAALTLNLTQSNSLMRQRLTDMSDTISRSETSWKGEMATLSDTLLGLTGSVTRATDRLTLLESSARRKFTNISDEEALMDVFKMVMPDERDANVRRNRGGFLVFAQGSSLWKLPVEDVGETKELSNIFGEVNHAVAVDCVNNHLYWTNPETGIRRSRYDGSDNHLVVTKAPIYFGLAVDFVSRNMFWVQGSAIHVAKMSHLQAGHKTIISHTEIDWSSALAVHPSRGSIYWSHSKTTIEAASMDGSNRQVLVTGVFARSLTLDYEANDLYWPDHDKGYIECISLNGGGKRIVSAQGSAGTDSAGISLSGGRVYWTSYSSTGTVNSITKSGSAMKEHSLPAGRSGYLVAIVFVPEQCPKLSNACAVSNGGCPFICLPLPGNNKKCVCPDGNSSCTS